MGRRPAKITLTSVGVPDPYLAAKALLPVVAKPIRDAEREEFSVAGQERIRLLRSLQTACKKLASVPLKNPEK